MFGIGLPELIVILVIALLIFGPKRLPELGQTIGKWISELRKATQDLSDNVGKDMKWDISEKDILPPDDVKKPEGKDRGTAG
jgi:sec-independent protein translocase protein TatA